MAPVWEGEGTLRAWGTKTTRLIGRWPPACLRSWGKWTSEWCGQDKGKCPTMQAPPQPMRTTQGL